MRGVVGWLRERFSSVTDSVAKLFAADTHPGKFRPQRMCPFCGLITSRAKAFCLECGKPLREVHP
jgi:hypothetical protein